MPVYVLTEIDTCRCFCRFFTHTGLRDRALLATLICGKSEQYRNFRGSINPTHTPLRSP